MPPLCGISVGYILHYSASGRDCKGRTSLRRMLPQDMRREHLHKLRHRGLLVHGIACQLAQIGPVDMPCPVDDGADVPLNCAPVAVLLLRQGHEYALLDAQETVFVVEHHPDRLITYEEFQRYCFQMQYTGMCRQILHLTDEEIESLQKSAEALKAVIKGCDL